jgi:mono/diheme cytochrome c family protein
MSESKTHSEVQQSREPKVGNIPTPLWAVTLLGLLAFVGISRLVDSGGAFDPNVYGSYQDFSKVEIAHPPPNIPIEIIKGKQVFGKNCAACHQASGLGLAPLFPPLVGSDWVNVDGHARIIRIVLNGLQGPITVNGKAYNNNMVPWKDALKDDEIADVLSYVRNAWGNKGSLVTAEEVKAIRAKESGKGEQWTAAELLAIPLK